MEIVSAPSLKDQRLKDLENEVSSLRNECGDLQLRLSSALALLNSTNNQNNCMHNTSKRSVETQTYFEGNQTKFLNTDEDLASPGSMSKLTKIRPISIRATTGRPPSDL